MNSGVGLTMLIVYLLLLILSHHSKNKIFIIILFSLFFLLIMKYGIVPKINLIYFKILLSLKIDYIMETFKYHLIFDNLILNSKKLKNLQKKNFQSFKFTHKFISNLIDRVRKSEFINKKINLVGIKKTNNAENGEIVVARIDEDVTLKRFSKNKTSIKLIAENSAYEDIHVSEQTNFAIEGKAVGVIRESV